MAGNPITDTKELLQQVSAFHDKMKERRRFERRQLFWAATVDVHGQRFEGTIVDLSPGGARIRFDAAVAKGDELTLVLKQLDELGAKVVWQREGETGLQFLLAPEDVAGMVNDHLAADLAKSEAEPVAPPADPETAAEPRPATPYLRLVSTAAIMVAALGALIGASVLVIGGPSQEEAPRVLMVSAGAADQHSCANIMGKVNGSTNQVDFSLSVASALHAKCLDMQHLGVAENDPRGHMVQATKVPLH